MDRAHLASLVIALNLFHFLGVGVQLGVQFFSCGWFLRSSEIPSSTATTWQRNVISCVQMNRVERLSSSKCTSVGSSLGGPSGTPVLELGLSGSPSDR
jgi:hypothetical protein